MPSGKDSTAISSIPQRLGWGVVWACVVVLSWSRFAGAPLIDMTMDDWRMLELARETPGFQQAWSSIWRWPDRPFGTVALLYTFHAFQEWLPGYALMGWLSGVAFMLFSMLLAFELTGHAFKAFCVGLVFCLLPTLTETFQWATMITYCPGFACYPGAAWLGIRFLKTGRWYAFLASLILYAFALGTYEVGFALAPVFLSFAWSQQRGRIIGLVAGWGGIAAFYLMWKFTGCFGQCHDLLFPRRTIELSGINWLWSLWDTTSWWLGGNAWNAILQGWSGFADIPLARQRVLTMGNLALTGLSVLALIRLHRSSRGDEKEKPGTFCSFELILFSVSWFLLSQLANLVSWSAGRLCLVPSAGFGLLVAMAVDRLPSRAWAPLAAAVSLICLTANQGTSRQWETAGNAHRNLHHFLRDHQSLWREKDLIVFDSRMLRIKQSGGLRATPPEDPRYWAYHGNASLYRGFVLTSMVKQWTAPHDPPMVILDVEHGALVDAHGVTWSAWYNPNERRHTSLEEAFVIDLLAASHYRPATGP